MMSGPSSGQAKESRNVSLSHTKIINVFCTKMNSKMSQTTQFGCFMDAWALSKHKKLDFQTNSTKPLYTLINQPCHHFQNFNKQISRFICVCVIWNLGIKIRFSKKLPHSRCLTRCWNQFLNFSKVDRIRLWTKRRESHSIRNFRECYGEFKES